MRVVVRPCLLCGRRRLVTCSSQGERSSAGAARSYQLRQQVYIEHTDCFAVTFYARYWSWLAAGREAALGSSFRESGLQQVLFHADGCRLASPAVLGDTVVVHSELVGTDRKLLFWRQSVCPSTNALGKPHLSGTTVSGLVDRHGVAHAFPEHLVDGLPVSTAQFSLTAPLAPSPAPAAVTSTVMPFAIELSGLHGVPTETDVLRWMERNRTDIIGGGAGLKRLQEAHTLVVVTSVSDFRMDHRVAAHTHAQPVRVCSAVTTKRRGAFIIFHQEAWVGGQLLAHADITCACVDANTMALMPAAPPGLLQMLTTAA
jgi:acyl-CoA thioesterase FadM